MAAAVQLRHSRMKIPIFSFYFRGKFSITTNSLTEWLSTDVDQSNFIRYRNN